MDISGLEEYMKTRITAVATVLILFGIMCELPQNPRSVENATFTEENLTGLPGEIPQNLVYPCTVTVRFPEFIDSFSVFMSTDDGSSEKVAGAVVENDTLLTFTIPFAKPGELAVSLYLYKGERADTLTHMAKVVSTAPAVSATVKKISTVPGDSAVLLFTASDPDSNLLEYFFGRGGEALDTSQFLAGERAAASVEKVVSSQSLRQLSDTIVFYTFSVMDVDSQMSSTALCTLKIMDTVAPVIGLLPPIEDTGYTVAALPDTVFATVDDNWGLDSITYGGERTVLFKGDTLQIVVGELESGTTIDTIEAWDRAGNRTATAVTLYYSGPKVFPPKIATIFHTVNEYETFDTVFLDNRVTITDPTATYEEDSLRWRVSVDTSDSDMAMHFDSLNRTLYVSGPDGELYHDRLMVLTLEVTDPNGVTTVLHGATFIMIEKDDPPVITFSGQRRVSGTQFDTLKLDTLGYDPEGEGELLWTIERGDFFYPESTYTINCSSSGRGKEPIVGCYLQFSGRICILPDTAAIAGSDTVNDTLLFTLKNVVAGDTTATSARIPFSWYSFSIIPIVVDSLQTIEIIDP